MVRKSNAKPKPSSRIERIQVCPKIRRPPGGRFEYREGRIEVPDAPGLGIRLDREKMEEYAELYRELGGYPYDRDPGHPGWYALVSKQGFADPDTSLKPTLTD